jgi:hypothetical protein
MIGFHVSITSIKSLPYKMISSYSNPWVERKSTIIGVIFDTIDGMINFNKDYFDYKVFKDVYDTMRDRIYNPQF